MEVGWAPRLAALLLLAIARGPAAVAQPNDFDVNGLPDFTGECVQGVASGGPSPCAQSDWARTKLALSSAHKGLILGRDSCAGFKSCCEDKRCDPGIYLLFRCAKKAKIFDPSLSYCKCSETRPTPPTSDQKFPNYTQECLEKPTTSTCGDFEKCCASKSCAAGVERRYECGYYNHDLTIQKSKAVCVCQNPSGSPRALPGPSLLLLAALLPLLPWRSRDS